MELDFSKLKGRIKEKVGTQEELERITGISHTSLSMKLNNLRQFTAKEILIISKALEIEFEDIPLYFFKLKVSIS